MINKFSNQQEKYVMLIPVSYFQRCRMERKYLLRESNILFQSSQSHSKLTEIGSLMKLITGYVCPTCNCWWIQKGIRSIYRSTESPSLFFSIDDNIKDIIIKDLIREDDGQMQSKDVWKQKQAYDRSFSFPEILEQCMRQKQFQINVFDKDELTIAQAKNIRGVEWPQWQKVLRKELSSPIK